MHQMFVSNCAFALVLFYNALSVEYLDFELGKFTLIIK